MQYGWTDSFRLVNGVPWQSRLQVMMRKWKSIGMLAVALAGLIVLLAPIPASAQSCALCYNPGRILRRPHDSSLEERHPGPDAPPTLMSVGVIFVCYRKRNQTMKNADASDHDWTKDDSENSRDSDW